MAKILTLLVGLAALAAILFFLLGDGSARGTLPEVGPQHVGSSPESAYPERAPDTEASGATLESPAHTSAADSGRRAAAPGVAQRHPAGAPRRKLTGHVIGSGLPMRGAQVSVYSARKLIGHVETDPAGAFLLPFPVPATELILRIDAYGFAIYELDLGNQHIAGQTQLGNIFLNTGSVLIGTVVDGEEQPIPGASIMLSRLRGRVMERGLGEQTRSDTSGRFKFTRAPSGLITLTARAPGFGERAIDHEHTPGKEARIELAPGTEVRVRVLDQLERPVAGAKLTLRALDAPAPARTVLTDRAGSGVFSDLDGTRWNLASELRGYRPGRLMNLAAGAEPTTLTLVEWPKATGRVSTPDDAPLPPGATVIALLASQPSAFAALRGTQRPIASDGTYVIDDLRPGSYRVQASAPGYAPKESEIVHVAESGTASVPQIELDRGGSVRLRLACSGEPAAGVRVELFRTVPRPSQVWRTQFGQTDEQVISDAAGELLLDGLAPGELWLILHSPEFVAHQLGPLTIARSPTDVLETRQELSRGGRIMGEVLQSTGPRTAGARVHIRGAPPGFPYIETGDSGHFESPPLPSGDYTLFASADDDESLPVEIRVKTGQVAHVKLILDQR